MGLMKTARDGEAPRSKDAPSPVSSGAVYTDYLESRRAESREYYDEMGAGRLRWIGRYSYYYRTLLDLARNLIPAGSRVLEIGCGSGYFLNGVRPSRGVGVDHSRSMVELAGGLYPDLEFRHLAAERVEELEEEFDHVLLVNASGEIADLEGCLRGIRRVSGRHTRLVILQHNFLWEPVLKAAGALGWVMGRPAQSWLSPADLRTFLHLAGYRILRTGYRCPFPLGAPGLSWLVNKVVGRLPVFSRLGLIQFVVARPLGFASDPASIRVSVVVPCKDEEANVPSIVDRIPEMGAGTEIIFVDDRSTDRTRSLIEASIARHGDRDIKLVEGPGEGKGACVRAGLAEARGDMYMILDADMTVMPEDLPRFFYALSQDRGEFANGSRLVYPVAGEAMGFLNMLGNKVFAWLFTYLLGQRVKDTLCGTKALWARDYPRVLGSRAQLGGVDLWGDYDWIFGAARHTLEIVEVPVHYVERRGGESKMTKRFHNAWVMLKVCWYAFWRLKML